MVEDDMLSLAGQQQQSRLGKEIQMLNQAGRQAGR
jgi:hypothetical protein